MVSRQSPARERLIRELGANITRWRKLQGLSSTRLADRVHVTRDTLRALEHGTGEVQLDSLLAVLTSLGIVNTMVESIDPWNSNAGRALMDEQMNITPPEPYRIAKKPRA
jgi:transcriptional regulator with XRE-family HTH domain